MKTFLFSLLLSLCLVLSSASNSFAQTPVPSPTPSTYNLQWDHDGVNLDGFKFYIDGTVSDLGLVIRRPDGTYRIPFPALTPGTHTLEVSAYNIAGESGKAVLSIRVVVIPADPTNLIIVVG